MTSLISRTQSGAVREPNNLNKFQNCTRYLHASHEHVQLHINDSQVLERVRTLMEIENSHPES